VRIKDLGTRTAPSSFREFLSRALAGRGPTVKIERQQLPYWQERGWTRKGDTYTGSYRTRHAAFSGHIVEHRINDIEFFLYQPSGEIRGCGHWACFQHQGNEWYLVHMGKRPKDVSSGILTIERLITEAYEY
jgi:hypothetical protein